MRFDGVMRLALPVLLLPLHVQVKAALAPVLVTRALYVSGTCRLWLLLEMSAPSLL